MHPVNPCGHSPSTYASCESLRWQVPLHDLEPHTDKALCAAWDGTDRIVSGGADGKLRVSAAHLPAA